MGFGERLRRLERLMAGGNEKEVGAFLRETQRDRPADAAAGAGDQVHCGLKEVGAGGSSIGVRVLTCSCRSRPKRLDHGRGRTHPLGL
jgi:hypothetical protein